jgi:hypothetical protein
VDGWGWIDKGGKGKASRSSLPSQGCNRCGLGAGSISRVRIIRPPSSRGLLDKGACLLVELAHHTGGGLWRDDAAGFPASTAIAGPVRASAAAAWARDLAQGSMAGRAHLVSSGRVRVFDKRRRHTERSREHDYCGFYWRGSRGISAIISGSRFCPCYHFLLASGEKKPFGLWAIRVRISFCCLVCPAAKGIESIGRTDRGIDVWGLTERSCCD